MRNVGRLWRYHKTLTGSAWQVIDACIEIAQVYQNGDLDHRPDPIRARAWWKKALTQGAWARTLDIAVLNLVALDHKAFNNTINLEDSHRLLRCCEGDIPLNRLQDIGIATIPFMLGEMSQYIADVESELPDQPKNILPAFLRSRVFYQKAEAYYRLAMTLPDILEDFAPARAQNALGLMHHFGSGVEKNDNQATYFFECAALAGLADGMFNLAKAHLDGKGAEISSQAAEHWLACALHRRHDNAALPPYRERDARELYEKIKADNESAYRPRGNQSRSPGASDSPEW